MNNRASTTISTKLAMQEKLLLEKLVEQRGTTPSEAMRFCLTQHNEQRRLEQLLAEQERRQYKATFAMLALALELKPEERKQIAKQLREIGVTW
jgi:hypothetical protein